MEHDQPPNAMLLKIHVHYSWRSSEGDSALNNPGNLDNILCDSLSPFSPSLPLTFLNILNASIFRLVKYQFARSVFRPSLFDCKGLTILHEAGTL